MTTQNDVLTWLGKSGEPAENNEDGPLAVVTDITDAPGAVAPVTDEESGTVPAPAAPAEESPAAAMARLLELAAHNADQLMAEAQSEADRLLDEARVEAERIRAELEESRSAVESELARLRQDEQDQRDRMRAELNGLLARLDGAAVA